MTACSPASCATRMEPEPGLRADLSWLHPRLGGADTLASYGVRQCRRPPGRQGPCRCRRGRARTAHRDFLAARPTLHRAGDCAFVHAGIRPGVALEDQTETDLVWIREPFLSDTASFGPLIVHGHTALDAATHYGNRLNIDSGAAYGGPLSAVVIEGREAALLTPRGRAAGFDRRRR